VFDGNPTHLFPMAEKERAQKIVALAGGVHRILSGARDALARNEFRWAGELTDFVLAGDAANADAQRLKTQALTELGERQTSANARNYYLSVAQYLLRDLPLAVSQRRPRPWSTRAHWADARLRVDMTVRYPPSLRC
jgi:alkyl sulfatase BDS1-like metallo-beta-lactamase superfamily hydrolase